jgi:hypothetical protein
MAAASAGKAEATRKVTAPLTGPNENKIHKAVRDARRRRVLRAPVICAGHQHAMKLPDQRLCKVLRAAGASNRSQPVVLGTHVVQCHRGIVGQPLVGSRGLVCEQLGQIRLDAPDLAAQNGLSPLQTTGDPGRDGAAASPPPPCGRSPVPPWLLSNKIRVGAGVRVTPPSAANRPSLAFRERSATTSCGRAILPPQWIDRPQSRTGGGAGDS